MIARKVGAENSRVIESYEGWEIAVLRNPLLGKGAALCAEIESMGGIALIVGGVVRDLLLGKSIKDVDIATSVPIEQLEQKFDAIEIGRSREFGILTIRYEGEQFEVANFRTEQGYSDSRRPDSVRRVPDFDQDSRRRDFTINSMGIDRNGVVTDYHGGIAHLKQSLIAAVGDPVERFNEDALRLLRAVRFAARMRFRIEPGTTAAIVALAHKIDGLAPERIRDELIKTASEGGDVLADYIAHLDEVGLLKRILPELVALQGLEHNPEHHPEGGVWEHVLAAVRASESHNPVDNLAILFHDLGKAVTRGYHEDGRVHYHAHEAAGVPIFDEIAERLHFANSERLTIRHAVEFHMLGHKIEEMNDKSILNLRHSPHWPTFKEVVKADAKARLHIWNPVAFSQSMDRVEELHKKFGDNAEFEARMSALIDGRMIMQITGAKGVEIGRIKSAVRDEILLRGFQVTPSEVEALIKTAASNLP